MKRIRNDDFIVPVSPFASSCYGSALDGYRSTACSTGVGCRRAGNRDSVILARHILVQCVRGVIIAHVGQSIVVGVHPRAIGPLSVARVIVGIAIVPARQRLGLISDVGAAIADICGNLAAPVVVEEPERTIAIVPEDVTRLNEGSPLAATRRVGSGRYLHILRLLPLRVCAHRVRTVPARPHVSPTSSKILGHPNTAKAIASVLRQLSCNEL